MVPLLPRNMATTTLGVKPLPKATIAKTVTNTTKAVILQILVVISTVQNTMLLVRSGAALGVFLPETNTLNS